MNHEDALKSIHEPLFKLWTVMDEEQQIAMGDTTTLMEASTYLNNPFSFWHKPLMLHLLQKEKYFWHLDQW